MTLINTDVYATAGSGALITPASRAVPHTSSATASEATRGVHANFTETLVVDFADGGADVAIEVVAGNTYPYRITKASTATGIVLLY